jgi:hypothetical protein
VKWLTIGASLAAVAIGSVCGQNPLDPLPDWVRQLSRAKNHLKENFARIPHLLLQLERYSAVALIAILDARFPWLRGAEKRRS